MSEYEGWIAAFVACLAYGSYGVPIKATLDIEVHPLVLQSYKTVVLFSTSWLVLALGEEAKWTPLGVVSGFLWVCGGTGGITGIRYAGMAVAVGTWASVMVLVNFVWGILIFQEPVHSFSSAVMAFFFLGVGLIGMSKYSSTPPKQDSSAGKEIELMEDKANKDETPGLTLRRLNPSTGVDEELVPMIDNQSIEEEEVGHEKKTTIMVAGYSLTHREYGILCAAANGMLGGSSLVPLHYVKAQGFGGRSYFLSFGTGSLFANCIIWFIFFFYQHFNKSQQRASLRSTLESMPTLHFKELWLRGLIAGLLLSIGMFGSIIATSNLGQGVGNSLVQCKIIVSGLWGIFWFKEIKDPDSIAKWFLSAALGVASILWLSYERNAVIVKAQ